VRRADYGDNGSMLAQLREKEGILGKQGYSIWGGGAHL
jgi:hypothetical protein